MFKQIFTLILPISFIVSCAPIINYAQFDNSARIAKTETDKVDVYTTPNSIPYKFKEIGLISIEYPGTVINDSEIITSVKIKARAVGADGILFVGENNISTGNFEGYISTGQNNIVKYSAIIYLDK